MEWDGRDELTNRKPGKGREAVGGRGAWIGMGIGMKRSMDRQCAK
jgi:hypothetical protein